MKLGTLKTVAIVAAVVLAISDPAHAAKAAKLVLRDGTVYEDVTFTVDRYYKVVTVVKDNKERNVSFTDIVGIYDKNDEDITNAHLGKRPTVPPQSQSPNITPSPPSPPVSDSAIAVPSAVEPQPAPPGATKEFDTEGREDVLEHINPFVAAMRIGGNFSIPLNDYYEGFTSGLGFDADLIIPVDRNLAIRLSATKSGMRDDTDKLFRGSGFDLVDDKVGFDVWRFFFAAEYFEWPRWRENGRWMYFLYSGLGAVTHSLSGHYIVRDQSTGEEFILTPEGEKVTKFMLTTGGGAMVKIHRHVGIDGALEFDSVLLGKSRESYGGLDYAFIFDVKLGLVVLF